MFKLFFSFCILFFSVNAKNETFTLLADESNTIVIPIFSPSSKIAEFNDTLNFLFEIPNLPETFFLYALGDIYPCFTSANGTEKNIVKPSYSCEIPASSHTNLNDPNFIKQIFENAITDVTHSFVYLKLALLLALKAAPLCDENATTCFVRRVNFIALTNYERIEPFYNSTQTPLEQSFFFMMTSAPKPSSSNISEGTYYIYDDLPNAEISEDIFGSEIYYTFDPTLNFFNVFIVTNESSLFKMVLYANGILEDAYSSISSYWGFLSPTFGVISVKLENGSYYQAVNVFLNGMMYRNFVTSLKSLPYGSATKSLETTLAQNYLSEIYDENEGGPEQWNVLITDRFPIWLKNTSIIFNSFTKHFDVYLMSLNDSTMAMELQNGMKTNLNDILVNDENATERSNHVLLIPIGNQSPNEIVKEMPTIKKAMGATIYSYKSPNRWWIFLIIGIILLLVVVIITTGILVWKFRKWRQNMQQFAWAIDSGISIKEANAFVDTGKEIFIDGNFIEVNFSEIIGKGSSAIVYEGFLSTESPISIQYPRLETRNYANCKIAVKIGNTFSKNEFEQIFREVEAAQKIGWHRHICCLLGWSVFQSMPVLMFELIPGKDLLTWAQSMSPESDGIMIPEKEITQILWQISDGMEHIASLGILHKDLAARNILLSERLEAKITDFGLASSFDESTFTYEAPTQRRLPLRWMAPEALRNRSFSEYSDVWSFGILAWEVFNKGEIPYGTIDGNDILQFISDGNRLSLPEEVSEEWKNLISKCWSEAKEDRPNFREIRIQIGSFLETQTIAYGYLSCELE